MRRVLRNYFISFMIIAFFALAVWLIDRWAEERESRKPPVPSGGAAAPASAGGTQPGPAPAPTGR